uniref:RING-type E3 ubiquitin transferase n=1 Tax=Periophthalmus magnuspinnatus TaxID=409849 RepID=A0A3B4BMR6_9GOBI
MPVQAAQWTEFLSCPICYNEFDSSGHQPISLGCSHTVCKTCLHKLHRKACPFDQTPINTDIDLLPVNCALLQLVGAPVPDMRPLSLSSAAEVGHYEVCSECVEELALYLKPIAGVKGAASPSVLSRPMQRKLVTLVNCQLVEEEGRVRAVRAGRSLGERTVTELILQHQNPQQLSANLWAAVRARGCQFLGPAMQEDALKLVLLALEDGSALSRKVLVLFVVQKLEARFPQASKTSIGHVVQLLYRASCFKVTKRDEDSSLMQLKEEFRTYEALRREHDAQIVHIAMEAGLRISPEQWSSLLYGDLVHKSHMQSIIDKLQSPESFAKSVQELTIVLQRTGDPANLTSLRPNLELLANIDHNPDAPPPSWEELESVMLAVKQVVHGLVEFIQNFSKKSHDAPQANSKYKTSMCRDLRQQGGCPRGTNCTFAHTQDELEKMPTHPTTLPSFNKHVSSSVHKEKNRSNTCPYLIAYNIRFQISNNNVNNNVFLCSPAGSFYPSTLHAPHKTCMARFLRSSNVPESSLPPSMGPPPSSFSSDLQPSHPPSSSSSGYAPHPLRERISHPTFHGHPSQPPYGPLAPAHGVYAPLYDSRRVWRPQLYHREDARSNSLPPEVLHSTVYQAPLRERFNSLDSNYCSGTEHRGLHRDYGRVPLGYEDLFRRKQEQWIHHHHHHHSSNRPAQSSPIFTIDFGTEHMESNGSPCMGCHFRGEESLAHYSPWSCGSLGPCISSFEPDSLTHTSAHSCSDGDGVTKPWLHSLDHYRRLKDEDPIIPFSEGPIISKWGAISRASRTGYHTTEPVQATACQASASTTAINFRGKMQLCSSDLRGRRTSVGTGEKPYQTVYGLDEERLCESEPEPDRDIELELCALDMDDIDQQDESIDLASPQSDETSQHLLSPSCPSPQLTSSIEERPKTDISLPDKMDIHLLKKMAFRKSVSPGGIVSGGLSVGKLVLRTGPPHLGDSSSCACSEIPVTTAVLLNGS